MVAAVIHLLSHTPLVSQLPVEVTVRFGFSRRILISWSRCFKGMHFLHLQGDNLVQTEAEVLANKDSVDCEKRL
jgi:hypothetical protein